MRLVVTRPEPEASRTAELLRARGHAVVVAPLLRVELIAEADLGAGPWGGVVITSATALRAIAEHPRKPELVVQPLFAVGRRSAEAAQAAGFADVRSADGDVSDLARLVAARAGRGRPLLYLAGEDRAADLATMLGLEGIALATVEVYRTVAELGLPDVLRDALTADAVDGVLHYSRRSADAFMAAARAAQINLKSLKARHFCMSAEVAAVLRRNGVEAVAVAAAPDQDALFAVIA